MCCSLTIVLLALRTFWAVHQVGRASQGYLLVCVCVLCVCRNGKTKMNPTAVRQAFVLVAMCVLALPQTCELTLRGACIEHSNKHVHDARGGAVLGRALWQWPC